MTPEGDGRRFNSSGGRRVNKGGLHSRPSRRRILFLSLEFNFAPFSGNGVFARSLVSGLVDDDKEEGATVRVVCARPHPSTPGTSSDIDVLCRRRRRRRCCCFRASDTPTDDYDVDDEVDSDDVDDDDDDDDDDLLDVWPIDLPEHCAWMRLDRYGPWREFSSSTSSSRDDADDNDCDAGRGRLAAKVARYRPTDVVAIDWHGILAWMDIARRCSCHHDDDWISSSALPPAANGVSSSTTSSWYPRRNVRVVYYNYRVYSSSA